MHIADQGPAIAAAFGLGTGALDGPVARGEQGLVWRLRTPQGLYAVKEPFDPPDSAAALLDAAYQEQVRGAGVEMPAVVRTVDGGVVAVVGDTQVRLYEWVDVAPRDRSLEPGLVGRTLAVIHRVVVPADGPVDEWYAVPVGAGTWANLARRLAEAGAPLAGDLAALLPEQVRVEAHTARATAVQTCHLDLWADNVRRSPTGRLLVLDWENSGPGDPSGELGAVLVEFGCGDPGRMRDLYSAYVDAGGPGRVSGPQDLTMVIAQLGHICAYGCERWLATTDPAERGHFEELVREYVDEPVTERIIETVLRAVALA